MDTLNTDCLREIVKYLDLKDQIALLQVSRQLQQIVQALWKFKYKNNQINFLERSLSDQDYEIFFKTISHLTESLELRFMDEQKYEILKKFTYPFVRNLRLTLHPCFVKDEDIKDFHRMFPKLQAFSPHGNLTGRYFDLWHDLKELNLSYCYKLKLDMFHHMLRVFQLEHLELNMFPISKQYEQLNLTEAQLEHLKYLRVNTYEFYYFLSKPLSALQKLIITNQYNPRQLFDVILATWNAKQIHKLAAANVDNVLANCLEMHMNVEHLCIISDSNVLPYNVIKSLYLLDDLRYLRFKNCNLTTVDLVTLFKSIPQLDEISLEDCRLSQEDLLLHVSELVGERSKVLRLNFWQNMGPSYKNFKNYEWKDSPFVAVTLKGQHHFFELTEKCGTDLCYEPLSIDFR